MVRRMTCSSRAADPSLLRHPKSVRALVFGLISIVFPVLGPVAVFLGVVSIREMSAQPGHWSGRGFAMTGVAFGVVGTIALVISVVEVLIALMPG